MIYYSTFMSIKLIEKRYVKYEMTMHFYLANLTIILYY